MHGRPIRSSLEPEPYGSALVCTGPKWPQHSNTVKRFHIYANDKEIEYGNENWLGPRQKVLIQEMRTSSKAEKCFKPISLFVYIVKLPIKSRKRQ